jgi:nitrite reductase/ring-hydroxylating ferredoxin subunit
VSAVWVEVADDEKVGEGAYLAVYPKGVAVLLMRIDGALHAIANKCAHMACPLEGGKIEDHVITCPCHDWSFDVRTGAFTEAAEIAIRVYPVKTDGGKILVGFEEAWL